MKFCILVQTGSNIHEKNFQVDSLYVSVLANSLGTCTVSYIHCVMSKCKAYTLLFNY